MTNEQKRKQIVGFFGAYSKRLEKLYDSFTLKLAQLAIKSHKSVKSMLEESPLYHFNDYPELRQELNSIFSEFVQNEMLCIKAGMTDGVALAFRHQEQVLTAFSVLSDKAIQTVRDTAAETFIRTRLNSNKGLGLSHLVWNYASQAKSEFEVAISNVLADGMRGGMPAADIARQVKQYLNNPDMMYRRYHRTIVDAQGNKKDIVRWRRRIVDANGKVRFVEGPLEEVGMGHYRSSRKNAERLMRTEINGAYHNANYERWQLEPFVIGLQINLSPQHPEYDMCDELEGSYPKEFRWDGWHPQCMCMSNPIMIEGEEKKEFYRRLVAGEDMSNYESPNRIKDVPKNYKAYVEKMHDKMVDAGSRGTLGRVWTNNAQYWRSQFSREELERMGLSPMRHKRIKTEEEKADIQARWDERKRNNEIMARGHAFLNNIKDFPEIERFELDKAIADRDYAKITYAVEKIRPLLKYERSITPDILLDSVMRKKYGDEAVEQLYANVKRTIKNKVTGDYDEKIKALRYEADWVVKNRSFATVKEVAAYYEREAVRLEAMRDFEKLKSEIIAIEKSLSKYGIKSSLTGEEWYGNIKTLQAQRMSLDKHKIKIERIDKLEEYAKTSKSPIIHTHLDSVKYAIQQYGLDANIDNILDEAEKNIKRLEAEKARNARKKMKSLAGNNVTVDDLKNSLGDKFPKSLEHLAEKIEENENIYTSWTVAEKQKAMDNMRELFANADFGMNVPRLDRRGEETFDKIFSSWFKSQIETGTGNGMVNIQERKLATRDLFGADINKMKPKEFEKYGFLMDKDILKQSKSGIADQYWNYGDGVQIRFKKDRVIPTFTMSDSLCSGLIPSLTSDPHITSFGTYRRGILDKKIVSGSVIEATQKWASGYIELQYHGELTIDCIESIFIPEKVLPKLSSHTLELMRKTGATLYSEKNGTLVTI